jgi:subtilisin-like proprotein convertase family protein
VALLAGGDVVPVRAQITPGLVWSHTVPASPCGAPVGSFINSSDAPILATGTNSVTSQIFVAGVGTYLWDVDVRTLITHTANGQLTITVQSPEGTIVTLSSRNGGANDDLFNGSVWDDQAEARDGVMVTALLGTLPSRVVTPLSPEEPLGAFRGEDPNGYWTLTVSDGAAGDGGLLSAWSLKVATFPQAPATTTRIVNLPGTSVAAFGAAESRVTVAGMPTWLSSLRLRTQLRHTNSGDLSAVLYSPAGTRVTLSWNDGGTFDNVFDGSLWYDAAGNPVTDAVFANNVTETPLSPRSPFSAALGENPNGAWALRIQSDGTAGVLDGAQLTLEGATCNFGDITVEGESQASHPGVNDTAATATTLNLNGGHYAYAFGSIYVGNADYWKFTAPANAYVWALVDTGGQAVPIGSQDSLLQLYGPDGTTLIEADDDDGYGTGPNLTTPFTGEASSIAARKLTEGGTYYLKVRQKANNLAIVRYRLYVVVSQLPEGEPRRLVGEYPAFTAPGHPIGRAQFLLDAAGATHVLEFRTVPKEATIALWVKWNGSPPSAPRLRIDNNRDFSSPLVTVDSTDLQPDYYPRSAGVAFKAPATGDYFVEVSESGANQTGEYDILGAVLLSPVADLAVTATVAEPVVAGLDLPITITVQNLGPGEARSAEFTMRTDEGPPCEIRYKARALHAGWTCSTPAVDTCGAVTCRRSADMAAGTESFVVTYSTPPGWSHSSIRNVGYATVTTNHPQADYSADYVDANNWASVRPATVRQSDVRLSVGGPSSVGVSEMAGLQAVVTNAGPSTSLTTINVVFPPTLTYAGHSASTLMICPPALVPGASGAFACELLEQPPATQATIDWRVTMSASAEAGSIHTAQFSLSTTGSDPNVANNAVNVSIAATKATPGDADGDALPDTWEDQFGLDDHSASGDNGALGDPDHDGLTNADEQARGTHPRGFFTRYFAEGATNTFFETRLALLNTDPANNAITLLRYLKPDGSIVSQLEVLPPLARRTVVVNGVAAMATAEFSTTIEADASVVADRTMRWDASGYGSHAETGVAARSTTWYLAEGSTIAGFNLFYLLQNPNATATTATVRYLRPGGAPPLTKDYPLPANSRTNIWVNVEEFNGEKTLAATDVSAVIATPDPIIVERAMYLDAPGQAFAAGHESAGVRVPDTNWFLAEGATGSYFDLFVLVANPSDQNAAVKATYLLPSGETIVKTYDVAANSRFNIWVDLEDAKLADTAVSTILESTNGVGIIVERAMWWPQGGWMEAHNSPGTTGAGRTWALAEGEQGGGPGYETYILVANTLAAATDIEVTLYFEDGTPPLARTFNVAANARFNVAVSAEFPAAVGKRFGAIVRALGDPAGIVVERAMYSGAGWAAGTNALATKLQ